MATTQNSDQFGNGISMPGAGPMGNLKVLWGSIDIATALTIGQDVSMFTAPQGFTPLFGRMVGEDLDTGIEALEIDIGIVGDTTKYLNSGVITGDTATPTAEKITVGIQMWLQEELMTTQPTAFTADTDIIATFTAAAVSGGTGILTVWMCGVYNDERSL